MEYFMEVFTVILLLVPGFIAMRIDLRLAEKRNTRVYFLVQNIILFSVAIYAILLGVYGLIPPTFTNPFTGNMWVGSSGIFWDSEATINEFKDELISAVIIGIILGFSWHRIGKIIFKGRNQSEIANNSVTNDSGDHKNSKQSDTEN